MIRIERPEPPMVFLEARLRDFEVERTRDWFAQIPERRSQSQFIFRSPREIPGFIDSLNRVFFNKCAFCEIRLTKVEDSALAFFRPREEALQLDGSSAPEYYWWLSWEWSNLYSACAICVNAKDRAFPTGEQRAPPHTYGLALQSEDPLLLDPCLDDPDLYLIFHENGEVSPRDNSRRGSVTIEVLDLNRSSLLLARGERARLVKELLLRCVRATGENEESGMDDLASLTGELKSYCDENQRFAGMVRQLLRGWLRAANSVPTIDVPPAVKEDPNWQGLLEQLIPQLDEGVGGISAESYLTDAKTDNVSWASGTAESRSVNRAADVGIIIALQEEFTELHDEIKDRCTPVKDLKTGNYNYVFEHQSVDLSRRYQCVTTFVGEMGPTKAGLAAQRLINDYNPGTLVVLGIAASLDADIKLGDVVVADVVDAYMDNSKAVGEDSFIFKFGGEAYRSSADWVKHARNFKYVFGESFRSWQERGSAELRKLLADEKYLSELVGDGIIKDLANIVTGHLASGPTVGASPAFTAWLKKRDRKYIALEMESAGVMAAVWEEVHPIQTLVLRAISDFGDERKAALDKIKGGVFRRYAIRNAIQLLWHFLDTK